MSNDRIRVIMDWTTIERQFRAGLLSVEEIGRQHGIDGTSIRYKAKKEGWKRDLTQEMRKAARTKIVEQLANANPDGKSIVRDLNNATDENIIQEAVRTQIEVIRQHQNTLAKGHSLTMRLLEEIDAMTTHKGELEELILSCTTDAQKQKLMRSILTANSRIGAMKDLAHGARIWITEERRAFSIAEDTSKTTDSEDLNKSSEELRQEIVRDAKRLGMQLVEHSLILDDTKVH